MLIFPHGLWTSPLSGWLEKYGFAASLTLYKSLYTMEVAIWRSFLTIACSLKSQIIYSSDIQVYIVIQCFVIEPGYIMCILKSTLWLVTKLLLIGRVAS